MGHAWHAGVLAAHRGRDRMGRPPGRPGGRYLGGLDGRRPPAGRRRPEDLLARATDGPLSAEATAILRRRGHAVDAHGAAPARPAVAGGRPRPASWWRSASRPWRLRPGLVAAAALRRWRRRRHRRLAGALHRHGWPDERAVGVRRPPVRRRAGGVRTGAESRSASASVRRWPPPAPSLAGSPDLDRRGRVRGRRRPLAHQRRSGRRARPRRGGGVLAHVARPDGPAPAGRRPHLAHRARISLQREVAALRRRGATVLTIQPGPDDLEVMGGTASAMDPGRRASVARTARRTVRARLGPPACGTSWPTSGSDRRRGRRVP